MSRELDKITPRNIVLLSDGDIGNLIEALSHFVREFDGEVEPDMKELLERIKLQPDMFEPERPASDMALTERGKQALIREVLGYLKFPAHPDGGPGSEELRAALNELEIAEAHFTISITEGKPGLERLGAIERRKKALDAAQKAAFEYGKQRLINH